MALKSKTIAALKAGSERAGCVSGIPGLQISFPATGIRVVQEAEGLIFIFPFSSFPSSYFLYHLFRSQLGNLPGCFLPHCVVFVQRPLEDSAPPPNFTVPIAVLRSDPHQLHFQSSLSFAQLYQWGDWGGAVAPVGLNPSVLG